MTIPDKLKTTVQDDQQDKNPIFSALPDSPDGEQGRKDLEQGEKDIWIPWGIETFEQLDAHINSMNLVNAVFDTVHALPEMFHNIFQNMENSGNEPAKVMALANSFVSRMGDIVQDEMSNKSSALETMIADVEKGMEPSVKSIDGEFLFYGRDSGATYDKEGEVFTDTAHRNYIKRLDQYPNLAPQLWIAHLKATAFENKAAWWAYFGGHTHFIWRLTPTESKMVDNFLAEYDPAMSHGYYVLDRDSKNKTHITDYWSYEKSILPKGKEAYPFSTFELVNTEQGVKMTKFQGLEVWQKDLLETMHGGEDAMAFVESIENKTKTDYEAMLRNGIPFVKQLTEESNMTVENQEEQASTEEVQDEAPASNEEPTSNEATSDSSDESEDTDVQFDALVKAVSMQVTDIILPIFEDGMKQLREELTSNSEDDNPDKGEKGIDISSMSMEQFSTYLRETKATSIIGNESALVKENDTDDLKKGQPKEADPVLNGKGNPLAGIVG